jgi:hypothetical protein
MNLKMVISSKENVRSVLVNVKLNLRRGKAHKVKDSGEPFVKGPYAEEDINPKRPKKRRM